MAENDKQSDGIEIRILGSSVRISGDTVRDLLRFLGPDRRWFIRVMAIGGLIVFACWGASLVR